MSPTDPEFIATEIAKANTNNEACAYFRWAVRYSGNTRPNADDFTLGVEIGFAEWNHQTNRLLRNLRNCDYLKSASHFAGMEFGETIAELLSQKNPNALQYLQAGFAKALV